MISNVLGRLEPSSRTFLMSSELKYKTTNHFSAITIAYILSVQISSPHPTVNSPVCWQIKMRACMAVSTFSEIQVTRILHFMQRIMKLLRKVK